MLHLHMSLSLSIKDRIIFHTILPKVGSMMEMHISETLLEKILLTDEEKKKIDLRKEGDNILFNNNIDDVDFNLSKEEIEFLKLIVKIKDEKHEVTKDIYPLFTKINAL